METQEASSILLLLLLTFSSTWTDDQTTESSYYGSIFQNVKQQIFGTNNTTGDPASSTAVKESTTAAKDSTTDSTVGVYSYVKSIPLFNQQTYDINVTFDSSKLNHVVNSISEIGTAAASVLKTPLDAYAAVKNSTTLQARSDQGNGSSPGLLDFANSIPIINQFGPKITELSQQIQFIKPGTKWCGNGDIAKDLDDIGVFHNIDSCCRDHDLCPENIVAQSTKYNLTNEGSFTRSSCNCDFNFYKCLKECANPVAIEVGVAYFDILKPQCFRLDFPRIGCKRFFSGTETCAEFEFDFSQQKRWQWFESPSFAL